MLRATILIVVVVLSIVAPVATFVRPGLKNPTCSFNYINSMRAYDCVGHNWEFIPHTLPPSTQILDASINRIRELTNSSLKRYFNIRKLYLNDNMILSIQEGTFDGLDSLETLDLSKNALIEVPTSIFHLPSLKHLMIGKNQLLDIISLVERALPITAPIQYLDLSHSARLSRLPAFGLFMDLIHLNLSGNHLSNLSVTAFVGLCNLRYLTVDNAIVEFDGPCECHNINTWFKFVRVASRPPLHEKCLLGMNVSQCVEESKPNDIDQSKHELCRVEYQARENIKNMFYICSIGLGTLCGILLFIGLCYVYHKAQRLPDIQPVVNEKRKSDKCISLLSLQNSI